MFTLLSPNDERERWEPAAADARTGTDLNGWLPSAPRFGWAPSLLSPVDELSLLDLEN